MQRSRVIRHSLSIALLGAMPGLAFGGDWYVDVNDPNCPNGNGSASSPFCHIGDAVSVAASGDTIHIAAGTYFENLLIDKALTLIGTSGAATTIVDGSSRGTVITVDYASFVDLEGLTITHGSNEWGGGLWVKVAGGAILDSCVILGNSAQFGGGISADSDVSLANCVVAGNYAVAYVVPGDASGGGICSNYDLTIQSSKIDNNYSNSHGGGIGGTATVTLIDSEVSGNHISAPSSAGGLAGGGAGIVGKSIHLTRSKIVSNHDDYDLPTSPGGGIEALTDLEGSESEITGNHASGAGGGFVTLSANLTDCVIAGNDASIGGGIIVNGNGLLAGCTIENNTATAGSGGGAILFDAGGKILLERCTLRGNVARSGDGGGAWLGDNTWRDGTWITLRDCVIADNSTTSSGNGGGLWAQSPLGRQAIVFDRCTIGGNSAAGNGGGIFVDPSGAGNVKLGNTILAGNTATASPDCDGPVYSNGYNCVGDTTGAVGSGSNTGNLLDVDPLYADPTHGDYSLQSTSPCADAGDPALLPTGTDVDGHPRLLDGDLDRVMVVDMGAYEFDNVDLEITGQATPGGTLTLTTTGTGGLPVLLLLGVAESELLVRPYGSLFVDLSSAWLLVPWGIVPNVQSGVIPSNLVVPVTLFFQEVALQSASGSGNSGNVVAVTIE